MDDSRVSYNIIKSETLSRGAMFVGVYANMGSTYANMDDGSVDTCHEIETAAPTIRHPTPAWLASSNITVTLDVIHQSSSGTSLAAAGLIAYTHDGVYLKGYTGVFRGCVMTSQSTSDGTHYVYVFECYCSYGVCEYVFTSLVREASDGTSITVWICDVGFEPAT